MCWLKKTSLSPKQIKLSGKSALKVQIVECRRRGSNPHGPKSTGF